jgi:hypothetical protein
MGDALDFLRRFATQIFQLPCVIIMAIAATRMHRSLVHFAHRPSDACVIFHRLIPHLPWPCPSRVLENFQVTGLKLATIKPPFTTAISLKPIDITAHAVLEQHPTPLTGDHDLPFNADEDVREKPSGLCLDKDVERGE